MKQTTNLDKFANVGSPASIFKIAFYYKGELRWVKYYEDRALFDKNVAHYKGDGGYGRSRDDVRLLFLQMTISGRSQAWTHTHEPLTRGVSS